MIWLSVSSLVCKLPVANPHRYPPPSTPTHTHTHEPRDAWCYAMHTEANAGKGIVVAGMTYKRFRQAV